MYGLWLFKEIKTEYGYCKIEIYKKSYSGSPIEIEAVEANSLTLSIENLSETISPIGKSVCSFSIVDTGQLSYDDFFTPDATGIKVVISTINEDRGDVAYTTRWSGFVTPDFYSESLVYRTAINISARDNIGYLSDVEFDLGEPSIQIWELFLKAFAKISNDYPMDVMFRSHKTTEDGVLLTDAVISTALFKDKTWGEVLELILHDMGLQMRWVDNNTIAVIDLSQIPEYYLPTQFQFINSSGYREILPAWRGLAQKQEFGIRENSFDGNILPQNLNFVEEIEIVPPSVLYARDIKYYTPTNWQTTGDIFTANPNDYGEPFGKRIYFTCANKDDAIVRYMSWRQPITASNSPMKITCKALNTLMIPANKLDSETGRHIGKYLREYIPATGKISSYWDGDVLQIGIKYNIILHAGLKSYIFKRDWIEIKEDTDLTPNQFILPEIKYTGKDMREDPEQPKEEELNIDIVTIPYTGELEFVLYGWEEIERRTYWEETFGEKYSWDKFFAYIADVTYTFDGENKATGQEAKTSINPLHNILRNENYQFGNVPKYGGGIGAYAGGLFNLVGEELSTFKRNENYPAYNLLELVGREIIHFNKKNYNKLSGEIKSPTKEPLKFNSLFSREGKLYYPFSCSLNVIDNTMTITSMQEVEPYTTESFTEIHSEVKSDGGTTVSGGNNTVLQYSEDAGNAKRLYEMQDATPAEKEKAFALVDSPDFPQARRIRVADLIGLDEQALAQYLELKKYVQEDDLIPLATSISTLATYFTNGSANNALKLGGIDAGNYWHKGNSGTLDYDWKAKKLNVRTLVIPTSEPTDLSQGEVGFYLGTAGQGAELPSGGGGLNVAELWAELSKVDESKQIDISHIPVIGINRVSGLQNALNNKADASVLSGYQPLITSSNKLAYSLISGTPTSLKNPYALTFGSKTYDGSVARTITAGDLGALTSHQDISHLLSKTDASNTYQTIISSTNKIAYSNISGTPTSLPASDVYDWAKKSSLAASDVPSLDWSKITSGKPTTLSGYGIRDKVAYRETSNNFIYCGNEFVFAPPAYSGYIWFNYRTASDKTDGAITEYRFAKGAGVSYANIRAAKYIVNGGTSSQFLKADGSLDSTAYLSLTGGTIKGLLYIDSTAITDQPLALRSMYADNAGACRIQFIDANNAFQGYVMSGWGNLLLAHRSCNQIGVGDSGIWCSSDNGTTRNALIHSGNIGSQSVNYASSAGNVLFDKNATKLYKGQNLNDYKKGLYGYSNGNNPTNSYGDNTAVFAFQSVRDIDTWQISFSGNGINGSTGPAFAIRGNFANQGWTEWYQIAKTSSNVASATKLQTARTIWGQSFDGTQDVNGRILVNDDAGFYHRSTDGNTYYAYVGGSVADSMVHLYNFQSGGALRLYNDGRVCIPSGNVLIGTTVDSGYKLYVAGNARLMSVVTEFNDEINRYGGYLYLQHRGSIVGSQGDARTSGIIMCANGGNVLIGSGINNGHKLQVAGALSLYNVVLANTSNALLVQTPSGNSWFGMMNTSYCHIYTDASSFYMNKPLLIEGNTVIHSGNIGSQSVNYANDAGKLGGTLAERFLRAAVMANASAFDANSMTDDVTIYKPGGDVGSNAASWQNFPVSSAPAGGFSLISIKEGNYRRQIYGGYNSQSVYIRSQYYSGGSITWNAWRAIAFTDSNVASATKLQTARTIWGQSFDGTGNVNGDLNMRYNKITFAESADDYHIGWGSSNMLVYANYFGHYFTTNGSERMRIVQNGNVLIGSTTDNGSKLQVNGAMEATELVIPTAPPTNPQPGKHYLYLA